MKKALLTILTFLSTVGLCFSQDIITTRTGEVIQAKVLEIGQSEIRYKKFENPDGPVYVLSKFEVATIVYKNGVKDIFNTESHPVETILPPSQEQREVLKVAKPARFYQNRIGLNVGGGGGFSSVEIGTYSDGTVASISFGGGSGGSLEYGYEFTRHFDLALDFTYMASELNNITDNINMTFERAGVSITPSFILPLTRRDKTRFKFGGGVDWYYYSGLKFDLSSVDGGVKDHWKYKNTVGGHLNLLFELNTNNRRFSFSAGLKMYVVSYSFRSGSISYPIDNSLRNPNGNGIDLMIGFAYHFNWSRAETMKKRMN